MACRAGTRVGSGGGAETSGRGRPLRWQRPPPPRPVHLARTAALSACPSTPDRAGGSFGRYGRLLRAWTPRLGSLRAQDMLIYAPRGSHAEGAAFPGDVLIRCQLTLFFYYFFYFVPWLEAGHGLDAVRVLRHPADPLRLGAGVDEDIVVVDMGAILAAAEELERAGWLKAYRTAAAQTADLAKTSEAVLGRSAPSGSAAAGEGRGGRSARPLPPGRPARWRKRSAPQPSSQTWPRWPWRCLQCAMRV